MDFPYSAAYTSLAGDVTTAADRSLIFASEWHFLREGLDEVYARVCQAFSAENLFDVEYQWDDNSSIFRASCNPGDVGLLWKVFSKTLDDIIKRELLESVKAAPGYDEEDDYTDFGGDIPLISTKIQRLGDYRRSRRLALAATAADFPSTDLAVIQYGPTSSPWATVVQRFEARTIWFRENSGFLKKCTARVLAELEALTGCKFHNQIDQLQIGGPSQTNVDLALDKLNNMFMYQNGHYTSHLFYSEDVDDVQFIVQPFVEVKNRYFRTTLLDNQHVKVNCRNINLSSNYKNLNAAMTIRCCIFNPAAVKYIQCKMDKMPKIQAQDFTGGLRFWAGFEYRANGGEETDLRRFINDLAVELIPDVDQPALSTILQIEHGPPQANRATENWLNQQQLPTSLGNTVGNGMVPTAAILGRPTDTLNTEIARAEWDDYIEHNINNFLSPARLAELGREGIHIPTPSTPCPQQAPSRRRVVPVQLTILDGDSGSLEELIVKPLSPQRGNSSTPRSPLSTTDTIVPHNPPSALPMLLRTLHCPINSARVSIERSNPSFIDDDISVLNINALEPSRLLPVTVASAVADEVLPVGNEQPIADAAQVSVPEISTPEEKLQASSEIDTRNFHSTMKQKVPKPNRKPTSNKLRNKMDQFASRLELPDSPSRQKPEHKVQRVLDMLPDFEIGLKARFCDMVNGLRGIRGDLMVQAEFGRIILRNFNPKAITKKGGPERPYEEEVLLKTLFNSTGEDPPTTTFFTNVLTVSSAECQYLIDMKNDGGSASWPTKDASSIAYRFYFCDTQSKSSRFLIDVDGEGFGIQAKIYHEWGNIYVHGTRRQWDFRISANGFPNKSSLIEKHSELVDQISRSLFIPPNMTTPELYFELNNALQRRYKLEEVQVRRLCQHKSQDGTSKLKVTEVQSLLVKLRVSSERESAIFQAASIKEEITPTEKLLSWYEAAISCTQIDEQLNENVRMELGDVADWTPDSLEPRSLYLPACTFLKRIDALGQANDNELDPRLKLPAEPRPIEPAFSFW